MSQFDEVSNIANPTFDAELATSMTVNAKLPKTPQRQSPAAGASDFALDSLDNKIPIEEIERPIPAGFPDQMANGAESFKAPQCEIRLQRMREMPKKVALPRDPYGPIYEDFRIDGHVIMFPAAPLARPSRRETCAQSYLKSARGCALPARGETVGHDFHAYGLHVRESLEC
jgi:hypothetical protein